ncbi:steroid delta-isomerase-like uncharacterized protein [Saccharopolyspora lacisalsi]|uniref:Steroid delta-isomerase-like uncharacterized protein n=1 Tax=Halosaccharopolyspora lacisalsi TaxID=1000566 RepID=A0A839E0I9_9PSEU|nr:ester cyclase [Halosaccharopolyspora lacisalsi]MBA8826610.1 steroid delta-isomerase-like uncharacterized protein [Halosaccharopolyspora lacisalsi]
MEEKAVPARATTNSGAREEAEEDHSEIERKNIEVVAEAVTHWNAHDLDALLELYAPNIVWYNAALEETYRGHNEVRSFLEELIGGFPDLTFTVDNRFARGDEVSERWSIRGTHRGTFIGIPPTKKSVHITGVSSIEMSAGKFVRDNFFFDSMSAMRQLGIMPALRTIRSPAGRMVLSSIVGVKRLVGVFGRRAE